MLPLWGSCPHAGIDLLVGGDIEDLRDRLTARRIPRMFPIGISQHLHLKIRYSDWCSVFFDLQDLPELDAGAILAKFEFHHLLTLHGLKWPGGSSLSSAYLPLWSHCWYLPVGPMGTCGKHVTGIGIHFLIPGSGVKHVNDHMATYQRGHCFFWVFQPSIL